jgi:endonuclease/exonuclease/phosphatase family metal-dependent hydrolase
MSRCSWFLKPAILLTLLVCIAAPTQAQDLRVATWNIQTLTTGKKVFPTQAFVRAQPDLDFLKNFATGIAADVVVLQEIASPAAAAQVFPIAEWTICISGQFFEAYPSLGHAPQADCFVAAPLPDTPASEPLARQFTALAVRKSAGFTVSVSDMAQLGVLHRDSDGQERPVRWGLVASVQKGTRTFTLLNVHLKSGCFHERLAIPLPPPPSSSDCETFARQVPLLDNFVRAAPKPFVLLGDFNRNLDLEGDQLFDRLTGRDTRGTADQTGLRRFPFHMPSICLPEPPSEYHYVPIDYLLISDGLRGRDYRELSPPVPAGTSATEFKKKFGDHCPKSLSVEVQ